MNDPSGPGSAADGISCDHPAGSRPRVRRRLFRHRWRHCARGTAVACGTVVALAAAASVATVPAASAGTPSDSGAYSRATAGTENYSDWMATVSGSTPIWQMSIPGTHDSYTNTTSNPSYQTQTIPVPEQLKMGIRALDLRLEYCGAYYNYGPCPDNHNDFVVEHGGLSLGVTFSGVLGQLSTFLSAHPTEFVILRVKVDTEGGDFAANFNAILNKYSGILWKGNAQATFEDPTLAQVRGKVVLLKEFPKTSPTINDYGMKYGADGFVIQDEWYLKSVGDLYNKWKNVVTNWTDSVAYAKTGGTARGYINFLSGNGGAYPYFVASGYSSPNGLPLATGLLSSTDPDKYPDFHWVSCVAGGTCTVAYTGTNILMYDVLSDQNHAGANHPGLRGQQGMGLIYIDFPGQPLVAAIIANNPYYGGGGITGPIRSGISSSKCVDLDRNLGVAGNKVQIYDCNGTPAQNWSVNANGTITINGGCMDITGGNYANGSLIEWWPCNGGANQKWNPDKGQLINPASGKCLDDPGFNTTNGTQLYLHTCNGGANQQWHLRTVPSMSLSASVTHVTPKPSWLFTLTMPKDATGSAVFYLQLPGGDTKIGQAEIKDGVATLLMPPLAPTAPPVLTVFAVYGGNAIYTAADSNTVTVTIPAP